ncbi:probable RNA-binding protein sce3 isoform X1 [Arachis hypogaea]|uniref:probable RNA-binding protein sce3 isoform X1 n=1 Tax=Arachis hypogaea TaxID=3818 RepID=UPI003B218884
MDCNSRRSKGFGYIEFYDVMSVPMAIALSGQFLLGQPVMVKPSEAEKNLVRLSLSSCLLMKVGTAKVLDLCRCEKCMELEWSIGNWRQDNQGVRYY